MLKKAILTHIFILILSSNLFAQNVTINVTYKEYYDTFKPVKRLAYLYSDGTISLYEEDLINTTVWIDKKKEKDDNTITILPEYKYNNHLKINHLTNEILFFDQLTKDDYYLITDQYINHNWKLINETKKIENYTCYKAEGNFRGRKWIAWYTPEINLSTGPWKLYGLPGLILEASDETRKYNYSAEKITFLKNNKLYDDFSTFRNEKLKKSTLKDFLNLREEATNKNFSKERGVINRISQPRNGKELTYEWEEQDKKN